MSANREPIRTAEQLDELERHYPGDMVRGYCDAMAGRPWPDNDPSPAYEHGRNNGVHDRAGTADPENAALAADLRRKGRLFA